MYYVYVLRSKSTNTLYTGQTEDLHRRIEEHNSGKGPGRYTKNKGPWELLYFEEFNTRSEALVREKYFKTGAGRDLDISVMLTPHFGHTDPPVGFDSKNKIALTILPFFS